MKNSQNMPEEAKFRTVGFPQYGFKRALAASLRRQHGLAAYMAVTSFSLSSALAVRLL